MDLGPMESTPSQVSTVSLLLVGSELEGLYQMKVTYDGESDIAYIAFTVIEDKGVGKTLDLVLWPNEPGINADLDKEGRLIGLEVFGARRHLPKSLLAKALQPG